MAKKPVTHRTITKPIYPALGTIASAKVMNEAEHNGTFAIEVMFAALKHRRAASRSPQRGPPGHPHDGND